jgi:hypothetical protein
MDGLRAKGRRRIWARGGWVPRPSWGARERGDRGASGENHAAPNALVEASAKQVRARWGHVRGRPPAAGATGKDHDDMTTDRAFPACTALTPEGWDGVVQRSLWGNN